MKTKLIVLLISSFIIASTHTSYAKDPIGILIEGYDEGCKVKRQENNSRIKSFDCEYYLELFEGDVITRNNSVKEIEFEWYHPYAGKKINQTDTELTVIYKKPVEKKGMLSLIDPMIKFLGFAKPKHVPGDAATKGKPEETSESEDSIYVPRPGYDATVVPGYTITFAWSKEGGKAIVFNDSKGNKVSQKKIINGEAKIKLTPEEIMLKPSQTYTWDIKGIKLYKSHSLRLLENETAQQIMSDLKKIEEKTITEDEKKIQKSAYLQLMSDTFPDEVDLYWMSYEVLKGLNNNELTSKLKDRYFEHINKTSMGR